MSKVDEAVAELKRQMSAVINGPERIERSPKERGGATIDLFRLSICETPTSMWSFHIRAIEMDEVRHFGGLVDKRALCGTHVGWDVRFELSAYGHTSHLPQRWCSECAVIAADLLENGMGESAKARQ